MDLFVFIFICVVFVIPVFLAFCFIISFDVLDEIPSFSFKNKQKKNKTKDNKNNGIDTKWRPLEEDNDKFTDFPKEQLKYDGPRRILSNDGFIELDNNYSYFRDSPRVDCCSHSSSSGSSSDYSSDSSSGSSSD